MIISEFPDGVIIKKGILQKKKKNRLAVGLSHALIIVSSYKNSGIMDL